MNLAFLICDRLPWRVGYTYFSTTDDKTLKQEKHVSDIHFNDQNEPLTSWENVITM